MKRYLLAAAFSVVLMGNMGCSGDKQITPAETVLLGCDSFASALTVVTGLNNEGKLNASTVEIVDHARSGAKPICEGRSPDVNASTRDIVVDGAARSLLSIAAQFGR